VIKNVFLAFEPLPLMNAAHSQPAIKPAIPVIHEDRVIQRLHHARLFCDTRQLLVARFHLGAQ
jgi:hypothetical protein